MTAQTISSTPTNNAATAWTNQKKEATLSIGREVVVLGDTTTNAKFYWSDDNWATKTDYGSDISGWSNGSIYAFLIGSTEYLVAVWKQSGTSGGTRTDGHLYLAVGAFDAGRTTLTWNATIVDINPDTNANYPDLVAHAESTGGAWHVATSYVTGGTDNRAYRIYGTVNSSGVPAFVGTNLLSATYNTTKHTWPSVDINPSTKDLIFTWSAGAAGVGKGVRAEVLTYSAGVWTPGSEIPVDDTRWSDAGTLCWRVRWDAGRSLAVIAGSANEASNSGYFVYDSSNLTTFTSRVSATNVLNSVALYGASFAIDSATGDVYLFGSQSNGSAWADSAYYKATRGGSSLSLGSRVITETFTGTATNPPFLSAWASPSKVGWVYTAGSASPFTVKADKVDLPQNTHQIVNAA